MSLATRMIKAIGFAPDERDGPLPPLLLVLTLIAGMVDAVSFFKLGHVFVANQTGNVVFLGFGLAGAADFSILASLIALVAFLAGAFAGGTLGSRQGHHRGRLLAIAAYLEIVLFGAALAVSMMAPVAESGGLRYVLIVLLGLAMGLQSAVARRLRIPDLTTTVLTMTMTGMAADAAGTHPNPGRRLAALGAMFLGAAIGAAVILTAGVAAVLALALALLALNGIVAHRMSASTEAWTRGDEDASAGR